MLLSSNNISIVSLLFRNSGHFDTPHQNNVLHGVLTNQNNTEIRGKKTAISARFEGKTVPDLSGYLNA